MPKVTNFRGVATPVYRCKECPHVVMGRIKDGWTCGKTGKTVPFNWIPETCPLDEVADDEK
jgi:ribosomal protein S27AE